MDKTVLDRYNSKKGADSYAGKFERRLSERVNNWHEQRLVRRLLAPLGRLEGSALDLPCGYGRLFPMLHETCDRVVEGDWGFEMLRNARRFQAEGPGGVRAAGFVRATALNQPFKEDAFELVLSVRLSHHIRELEERKQHLSELCRISQRYVLFTYFDYHSLKNRWRELRRKFVKKRAKWTLRTDDVRTVAAGHGFELVKAIPLSRFFSGHKYALLTKT